MNEGGSSIRERFGRGRFIVIVDVEETAVDMRNGHESAVAEGEYIHVVEGFIN